MPFSTLGQPICEWVPGLAAWGGWKQLGTATHPPCPFLPAFGNRGKHAAPRVGVDFDLDTGLLHKDKDSLLLNKGPSSH